MRMPRSPVRRRFRSRAAMRLNQTISRWALRITTPSGSAAVERCSWRISCTKRCLWKALRRCSRTTCAMISPHTPPTSGGSAKLRCRSHHSSRNRLASTHPRCSASAQASPAQRLPSSQPAPRPTTTVANRRPTVNHHICVAGCIRAPSRAGLSTRAGREAIARAAHGLHEAIVPEFLERLAQTANMHVDRAFFDVNVAAPDAVEELIAGVDALRVGNEELEHAVFGRTEPDGARTHDDPMAPLVEHQPLELDQLI